MALSKQITPTTKLIQFCNWAKTNGYRVGEMHGFSSVASGVHAKGSWHHDKDPHTGHGLAADINYGTNGPAERAKLLVALRKAQSLGLSVIFARDGTAGVAQQHQNHLHVDVGEWSNLGTGLIRTQIIPLPAKPKPSKPSREPVKAKKRKPKKLPTLSRGKRRGSYWVGLWQEFLRSRGYKIALDKIFGNGTYNATRAWQRSVGLKDDGVVGILSWSRAVLGVRPGQRAPSTKIWQRIVGLTGKHADGIFGARTTRWSEDVQRWLGVTPDAIAGSNTVNNYRKKA